jgi:hypothetical protein
VKSTGVQLTEVYSPWRGFMMEPVSVRARRSFSEGGSALVFHHPDCTYFGLGDVSD